MFFLDLECCHFVLVVQYFCQWLHYDNLWKIRTFKEHGHAELWKTTLKYKNLFSLTSKILGSYMWVFTVLQLKKDTTFLYTWSMKKGPQLQLGGAFTYKPL